MPQLHKKKWVLKNLKEELSNFSKLDKVQLKNFVKNNFKFLGCGCSREAYLVNLTNSKKVVIKLSYNTNYCTTICNKREVNLYKKYKLKGIPKLLAYDEKFNWIISEYIPKSVNRSECYVLEDYETTLSQSVPLGMKIHISYKTIPKKYRQAIKALQKLKLVDIHEDNLRKRSNNEIVFVDYAT